MILESMSDIKYNDFNSVLKLGKVLLELFRSHLLDLLDFLLHREGVVLFPDPVVVVVYLLAQGVLQSGQHLHVLLLGVGHIGLDGDVEHLGDFLNAPLASGGQVL